MHEPLLSTEHGYFKELVFAAAVFRESMEEVSESGAINPVWITKFPDRCCRNRAVIGAWRRESDPSVKGICHGSTRASLIGVVKDIIHTLNYVLGHI